VGDFSEAAVCANVVHVAVLTKCAWICCENKKPNGR